MAHGHVTNSAIFPGRPVSRPLFVALGLQDLLAAIVTIRADMVTAMLLAARRLDGQLR